MPMTQDVLQLAHGELTKQIIDAFHTVFNELGDGFVESVYVRALQIELRFRHVPSHREAPLVVHYRGEVVGEFRVDLLVDDLIIVEVKTAEKIAKSHERQVLNYLKAAEHPVGLILNVSDRPTVRRKIWTRRSE